MNRGALAIGAAAALAWLLRGKRTASDPPTATPDAPWMDTDSPPPTTPAAADADPQEVEALARMLVSETGSRNGRIVIGWITIQVAKRRKQSIFQLLTRGAGYGKQARPGQEPFYASTAEPATVASRQLARELLRGAVLPSAQIRKHRPGAWVERRQNVTDDRVLELQRVFSEGIYARVAGTNWMLYSRDAPQISIAPYATATGRLDAVPVVPATDAPPAVA